MPAARGDDHEGDELTDHLVPDLPPGRHVRLPGRGTTFVRELPGPHGAPTVLLLHGWTATADLNFFPCYAPLAEHFRVVAIDLSGQDDLLFRRNSQDGAIEVVAKRNQFVLNEALHAN